MRNRYQLLTPAQKRQLIPFLESLEQVIWAMDESVLSVALFFDDEIELSRTGIVASFDSSGFYFAISKSYFGSAEIALLV